MTYNIVAGSYGLRSNADGLAERLKQNGYSTSPTIIKDGMMYRVISASTDDKSQLPQLVGAVRPISGDSWVLLKK
jgi:hypothetical protein